MEAFERYDHAGCMIELYYDEDPMSPREWTQLGVMLCWHRDYLLGDLQLKDSSYAHAEDVPELIAALEEDGAVEIMPLYLFDHSGISMSVSDTTFRAADSAGWDWGLVGLIYATPETLADTGALRDNVRTQLIAEVEEYDDYLTGSVYGFVVVGPDDETLDSCWGFLGDDGLKEAKRQAESYAESERVSHDQLGAYEMEH